MGEPIDSAKFSSHPFSSFLGLAEQKKPRTLPTNRNSEPLPMSWVTSSSLKHVVSLANNSEELIKEGEDAAEV